VGQVVHWTGAGFRCGGSWCLVLILGLRCAQGGSGGSRCAVGRWEFMYRVGVWGGAVFG